MKTTNSRRRAFLGSLLAAGCSLAASSRAQTHDACGQAVTTRDVTHCLASAPHARALPVLAADKVYTLPELIDIAEMASPEGRIAWAHAKRAMEEAGVARALYLPVLSFEAQGSDLRAIVPFPKPIAPRGYVTVEEPTAAIQLQLEYSVVDFSRGARVDAGKALAIGSALQLSRTNQRIAYTTAVQFYRTQLDAGRLEAAKTILQTAETLLENAQSQYDNGRATLPDVQNAQAGAAQARFELSSAEGAVQKSKLALTETIGIEPTTEIQVASQAQGAPVDETEMHVEELVHSAWKTRPDLLARAQDLRHARDAARKAQAAYLPSLTLGATGGQTALWPTADYGLLGHASVSTWSVEAKLRWELFNGARKHEVGAAMAEEKTAGEEQRAAQDAVTREVWQAYVDYRTAIEQERSADSFLKASETSYDSSLDAYKYGVRSLVDVVQAERQLAQARLAAVQSKAQYLQSAITLTYATGSLLSNDTLPGVTP
ncbi:Outer membrane protein TolC [Granulicella rosea]|uniref:Outer membrane protein TolC n=1 Tax=Granulicella rosea TaxID=474952 RepID=A0A239GXK8_9BACT|nr:TolC family protein [Granulicella rosea]SNS72784.1 Outer membrane protein TolC [Granulicella rosea]